MDAAGDDDEEAELYPFAGATSSSSAGSAASWAVEEDHGRGWEMVAAAGPTSDVFPPSLHEGLHLYEPQPNGTLSFPLAKGWAPAPAQQPAGPPGPGDQWWTISDSARRVLEMGFELVRSKLKLPVLKRREGFSVAAVVGVAGALLYLRRRHRREKDLLLSLLREKDQKIVQLMQQIALMNEVLAAHRKVAVIRRT